MNHKDFNLYSSFNKIRFLKSYTSKIMIVAFLGAQIPLSSLLFFFAIFATADSQNTIHIILLALLSTFIGTFITLFGLRKLLAPIVHTSKSLRRYKSEKILPDLPTEFHDEVGTLMRDTASTVKKLDELVHYLVNYDGLTGLPNRTLFLEKFSIALRELSEKDNALSMPILSLEVTRIKEIRFNYGLHVGDLYLRGLAQKLEVLLGQETVLARTGDGEFSFFPVLPDSKVLSDAEEWAKKIQEAASSSIQVVSQSISSEIKAGIAVYPFDGKSSDQLLVKSETALNQAKQSGFSKVQSYSSEWKIRMKEKYLMEKDLIQSIAKEELFLQYQPRIDLQTGKTVSAEALVRWQHPDLGIVSPAVFIPIAEESGFIMEIGEFVLEKALEDLAKWKKANHSPIRISINLSAKQLEDSQIPKKILRSIEKYEIEVGDIELEITESSLITNMTSALEILAELHSWGIALSLDDFGTGYSNLAYLSRLPLRTLKIDQSFVRRILVDSNSLAISRTIVALGKSLGLRITAEGIETEDQLRKIRDLGCDEVQGFYFSRPISFQDLIEFTHKK
ncbi:diguanylate cyclase (GGDEF) domain protein [Leptospira fainei serovar Hurstbridge str. BUT 6]|uniref:Diguanylate cyclase (GGDEF) domain protein n=1 Tax=Leptospira fainei serovar Hurstbridge str. BUT 6 TaxID=1193011 RepID=S3UR65_9LEPT|nr:bifunctional diguanylate cyclase/phosphodiesterase [Leptospira fainei]EPG72891.1 diguanylate cyclase (GGDEF) domain protein [Leptospira fainei serovar Hurstbridge str. BUT 6]